MDDLDAAVVRWEEAALAAEAAAKGEDPAELGAPEGFMDAAGDIPRWQYLRDKALKERKQAIALALAEQEQEAAQRRAAAAKDDAEVEQMSAAPGPGS